jgi:hypothetical protein
MKLLAKLAAVPKNRINNFLARYFGQAELVVGRLKDSDQEVRCLCVSEPRFRAYLYDTVFAEPPRRPRIWRTRLANLKEVFAKPEYDIGVALIPKNWEASLKGAYSYRTTQSVRQNVDISASWEHLTQTWSNRPQTTRKIRKYSLSYRVSHDLKDFDLFYYQMNLPLVRKQFGDSVSVDPYEEMKLWFEQGFLLLVLECEKPVAGGLCKIEGDTLVYLRLGVLNADHEYMAKGAQAASYYFILAEAKEKNLKKVSFITSSSFVHDGVYTHKARWGAAVSPNEKAAQSLLLFLPSENAKATLFLEKNPVLVTADDGTLDLLTGWSGTPEAFPAAKEHLLKTCVAPGVHRLLVRSAAGTEVHELEPTATSVS